MKLRNIVNARTSLCEFREKTDFGAHLAYWIVKFLTKTQSEYDFYTFEVKKIFDKYARQKEDDALFIPADKISEFNAEVNELEETDVEDPGIRFSLSELASELKLSMKQMSSLLEFIDEDK